MAPASLRCESRSGNFLSSLSLYNVVVGGRRTSVRLEASMWEGLQDIAHRRGMSVNDLVTEIERNRGTPGLTAAIRVYIVNYYRNALGMAGGAEAATQAI